MRRLVSIALLLSGCRFGFDLLHDDDHAPDAGDAPDAPLAVCSAACEWGCVATNAQCAKLVPVGGAVTGDDVYAPIGPLADLTLSDPTTWVFTSGMIEGDIGDTIRSSGSGLQAGIAVTTHTGVAVFRVHTFHVTGPVRFLKGTPNLAFAIIADDIVIDAVLDVRGDCANDLLGGPGGFAGNSGLGPSGHHGTGSWGGGGGGNGGHGGQSQAATGGNAVGVAPFTLVGGGGGGVGGNGSSFWGAGGGGGGALQLVASHSITIGPNGGINAGGCGAFGGNNGVGGGGGGGAGGTIVLEAPAIEIAGKLAVNGGAGATDSQPQRAEDGELVRAPASYGAGLGGYAGAPDGGSYISGTQGGGGGGAVGRMRFETKTGLVTILAGALLSPNLEDQTTTVAAAATVQ